MTLGFAMVVKGGVVLVADGRVTASSNHAILLDNNKNKVHQIQSKLGAITGGIVPASEYAMDQLRPAPPAPAEKALEVAARGLEVGFGRVRALNPSEWDASPLKRAAVLLAGIDPSRGPYVGLASVRDDGAGATVQGPRFDELSIVIFSTNDAVSTRFLDDIRISSEDLKYGPRVAQAVVDFAATQIAAASLITPTIGGTVRGLYVPLDGDSRGLNPSTPSRALLPAVPVLPSAPSGIPPWMLGTARRGNGS